MSSVLIMLWLCNFNAFSLIIIPKTYPCLQHAKCQKIPKNLHQGCCRAICPHHFIKYFAGRRTSSVVGSIFWGKFVGLRSSLVEVTAHTGIALKICSVYFLKIGMFISQTSSISPVSCLKHTPLYSTQNARKHPKPPPGVLSGDISAPLYSVFRWSLDQLGGRLNVLGKVRRAQNEVWRRLEHALA